ncbi:sensor domain-containing diguanylate cyclase [Roseateles violae]|uniref:Diguanylate cyclase n=1 Tax=Roseateles violae TaxID=3058042 RepID=A0ABT8DVI9_9BURK|nr:diguanylate cyclase [Pelomonas sp. PFR6]MDN3920161.1 diguanylate cyclase [Pelomonas sp. PFR6]
MPLGSLLAWKEGGLRRRRKLALAMVLTNLAVAALLALLVWLVLRASHSAFEGQARDNAEDMAAIAQASVGSELARVDSLMRSAIDEIGSLRSQGAARDADINRVLEAHRRLLPSTEGLRMADESGLVRWGNALPAGPPVNVADRPYFLEAKARGDEGRSIAGPLQSRVSGNWVIALVRPVRLQGRFAGVLYASVQTDYFRQLFSSYDIEGPDAVTLRMRDMQLIARYSPASTAKVQIGSTAASPELKIELARNPTRGIFVSKTVFDGIERTNAYRQVEGWPMLVFAGLSNERFYAPWRAQVLQVSLLVAVAWLLFAGATFAVHRAGRREFRSLRALAAEIHRTQALLHVAADGIHIVDRAGRLVGMSDSFAEMLGATRESLLGRHISSWDVNQNESRINAWLAKLKDGDRQRVEVQHRRDDGRILDVELQISVAKIDQELFIYGSARDISERKRLLASIEESSARIRDLYDQAPCGYHSIDARGVFVHVNATMLSWLGCTAEEVIGRTRLIDFLDEEGRATYASEFPRLVADGRLDGVEFVLKPRHGAARRVRASVTALRDADGRFLMSRSVTQDVTGQYEARQQIAGLMREQTAMLDNDIVGMAKLHGRRVVWKNRALARIFGYAAEELEGETARILYPDDETFERVGREAYALLAAGEHYRTHLQLLHKDGRRLWIDLCGVQLTNEVSLWTMADITAVKEAQTRAEYIAFHDGLTGLPNRLLLADRLRQAVALAARTGTRVAVCYLDLDGFKQVNDRHGHDAGDALLAEVGRRLQQSLRRDDTAARVGGDEFVLLLTMLEPGQDEWRRVLERLIAHVQAPIMLADGIGARVGASIGVAIVPEDGDEPSALLAKADHAMLRAKRAGKRRVELATPA